MPFCIDPTKDTTIDVNHVANVACTESGAVPFNLTVQGAAIHRASHSTNWGFEVFSMKLNDLKAPVKIGCPEQARACNHPYNVLMVNEETGFQCLLKKVIHWAWAGKHMFFNTDCDLATINEEFPIGDEIKMYKAPGKSVEDNLALTFVHGKNPEFGVVSGMYNAKSRIRFGYADSLRDGTVWVSCNAVGIHHDIDIWAVYIIQGRRRSFLMRGPHCSFFFHFVHRLQTLWAMSILRKHTSIANT